MLKRCSNFPAKHICAFFSLFHIYFFLFSLNFSYFTSFHFIFMYLYIHTLYQCVDSHIHIHNAHTYMSPWNSSTVKSHCLCVLSCFILLYSNLSSLFCFTFITQHQPSCSLPSFHLSLWSGTFLGPSFPFLGLPIICYSEIKSQVILPFAIPFILPWSYHFCFPWYILSSKLEMYYKVWDAESN